MTDAILMMTVIGTVSLSIVFDVIVLAWWVQWQWRAIRKPTEIASKQATVSVGPRA
jgi:hypothetical protein